MRKSSKPFSCPKFIAPGVLVLSTFLKSNLHAYLRRTALLSLLLLVASASATTQAQTTAFTYQGRLTDAGSPAAGAYDLQFKIYDALSGGTQIGGPAKFEDVAVSTGSFTVTLDFGAAAFPGADRWLEIGVRPGASTGAYTTLTPRQQITSTPYAAQSLNATTAVTAVTATNATQLNGQPASQYLQTNGNGSGLTNLNGANITDNTINASALASDTFPNNQNLSRLGSLRWDLLGQRLTVGSNPFGIAFDGANMWVVNNGSNNVTKLRASDGALLGTFTVGSAPFGVAFDGANIWVANNSSNNVTKLRASDGAVQGTFVVGTGPFGVAFDGANIWVTNDVNSGTVTNLRASDGAVQGTFAVGSHPEGVAFNGVNILVSNAGSNNVTKLRASDGAFQGTVVVGSTPQGVAFDGANIWVTNNNSNTVTKLRTSDLALLGTFTVGSAPVGVAFDGANIWVANSSSNVTKLRASDGALLGTFSVGTGPVGVAFDGASIWVTNFLSSNVVKLPVFP